MSVILPHRLGSLQHGGMMLRAFYDVETVGGDERGDEI
jgi:hypothetical protein